MLNSRNTNWGVANWDYSHSTSLCNNVPSWELSMSRCRIVDMPQSPGYCYRRLHPKRKHEKIIITNVFRLYLQCLIKQMHLTCLYSLFPLTWSCLFLFNCISLNPKWCLKNLHHRWPRHPPPHCRCHSPLPGRPATGSQHPGGEIQSCDKIYWTIMHQRR